MSSWSACCFGACYYEELICMLLWCMLLWGADLHAAIMRSWSACWCYKRSLPAYQLDEPHPLLPLQSWRAKNSHHNTDARGAWTGRQFQQSSLVDGFPLAAHLKHLNGLDTTQHCKAVLYYTVVVKARCSQQSISFDPWLPSIWGCLAPAECSPLLPQNSSRTSQDPGATLS